jgi:hypothetical protein
LIKTFFFGIILGIAVAAGALYALPVVDQYREASIISVAPNGGSAEVFNINIPTDRIMVGGPNQSPLPADLVWPQDEMFGSINAELFKVRNAHDSVIGVAARTSAREGESIVLDWVIHIPARGSMYVNMNPVADEDGYRSGEIRAGSRELASISGVVTERWVADTSGEADAPTGHLELATIYISTLESDE